MMQQACGRLPLNAPSSVIGTADANLQQLLALANQEGDELGARHPWQNLTREATFVTVAAESQGNIFTIAGSDYRYIVNETIWNRTLRRPLYGPMNGPQWQALKAMVAANPWNQYRIRGNFIIFTPNPPAGQTCAFEWITKNFCTDLTGVTQRSAWAADSDLGMLDEGVMAAGIIWRWKSAKGLEYAEDFNTYERRVADAMARDGGKPILDLGGTPTDFFPGVFVPAGSWPLP